MITPTQNRRSRNALLLSALAVVMTVGVTGMSHSPVSRLSRVSDQVSETITSNQEAGNNDEQKEPQREEPVRVEADRLYEPLFIRPDFGQTPSDRFHLKISKEHLSEEYLRLKLRIPEFPDGVYRQEPKPIVTDTTQSSFNFRMINSAEPEQVQPLNGEEFISMRFQYRMEEHARQTQLFFEKSGKFGKYKSYDAVDYVTRHRLAPVNEAAWEGLYPGDRIKLMEAYRCILTKGNMHITSPSEQERITRKKMREDLDNRLAKCSTKDLERGSWRSL